MDDDERPICAVCGAEITSEYFVSYKGDCSCSKCEHDFFIDYMRFDFLESEETYREEY